MQNEQYIPVDECCINYNIEVSFVNALQQYGLVQMTTIEQKNFIDAAQLHDLEKFIRMHYDLEINLEGIEAISHMLRRIENLQQQLVQIKNQLQVYKSI